MSLESGPEDGQALKQEHSIELAGAALSLALPALTRPAVSCKYVIRVAMSP